eukprot:2565578-Rhodomonas_salina.1
MPVQLRWSDTHLHTGWCFSQIRSEVCRLSVASTFSIHPSSDLLIIFRHRSQSGISQRSRHDGSRTAAAKW